MAAQWGRDVKTLGDAWREFRTKRSPRVLAVVIVAALALRIAHGGLDWRDLAAVAAMLAVYPFGEWAIHVYVLHMPPITVGGRTLYLPTARSHWAHHREPARPEHDPDGPAGDRRAPAARGAHRDRPAGAAGVAAGGPGAARGPAHRAAAGYVLVGVYEWTHFLIHTAHRPRTRLYRAVWQTHRLHHFKNEHYWHGVTTTVADRLLGTAPDHRAVQRSATARTLDVNG